MLLLTNKTIEKLKHDLVRENLVELEGLILAQENAEKKGTNLAEELVKENLITETELLNFIEDKLHIPFVDLKDYKPDTVCLMYVSPQNAQRYNIFPLFKIEDVLTIAMSDPLDLFTINTLFEFSDISIEPVVCSESSIKEAINKYYLNKSQEQTSANWQDMLISDNISDEILRETIFDILKNAIDTTCHHIFMERSQTGLNLFFNKDLKGYIPNLLVPRFMFEFKNIANLDNETEEVPQNSKFIFSYKQNEYSLFVSFFPTKFGTRISLIINSPLKDISSYNINQEKLNSIFEQPALISLDDNCEENSAFSYALAEYLSAKHSVLMVENQISYELNRVAQLEFNQNTAIYFDEIINQIDLQKFDIIFWEKIYTKEQAEKLKLLANEHTIITKTSSKMDFTFDFAIDKNGKIS